MKRTILLSLALILSGIVTAGSVASFSASTVHAVSGACYFQNTHGAVVGTSGCGESGAGACGTNDVFTGRNTSCGGTNALSGINTKSELVNFISSNFNGSNVHDKIGAHFIVCEMLNKREWNNCDLATWKSLMNQSDVSVDVQTGYHVKKTSWYDDDKKNEFYDDYDVLRDVVRVKQDGTVVARIEVRCGNLVAGAKGIESPKWAIAPSASVNNGSPRPGNTATWTLNAKNKGPDATDETVNLKTYVNTNGGAWGLANDGNVGAGWGKGAVHPASSWTPSWTPSQGDDGTTICRFTRAKDASWDADGDYIDSAHACSTAWQKWQVSASTTESHSSVSVGSTITWTHKLTHNDDYTSATVTPSLTYSGSDTRTITTPAIAKNWPASTTKTYTNAYTIKSTDAGKTLCQGISATPSQRLTAGASPSGAVSSAQKCVYIPYDYELTPSVSTNPSTPSEVDTPLTINPEVNNAGPTQSETVQWEVHRIIYDPGASPSLTGSNSTSDACGYFSAASRTSCDVVSGSNGSGSKVFPTGVSTPNASALSQNIPALDPGARVCYVLSIKPWKNRPGVAGGTDWRHSNMVCVIVAKKPKLHIEDGDLKTHGSITTSTSRIGNKTYGSWVDYGILSVGSNNVAASGAGLRSGYSSNLANDWSKLTFANTPTMGNFTLGTFASAHDYFMSQDQTQAATSPVTLAGTGVKIINVGGNVTINTSTIPVGGTFIVQSTGTVTIAGNISYSTTGDINSIRKIPQVVIAANNINIKSSVTRVDAWLLATGNVNTCSDGPTGALTANDCSSSLAINGPVSAGTINVRRTAGATKTNPELAAETIRLTPTTYLWAYGFTGQDDRVKTTYVTEEPPRF